MNPQQISAQGRAMMIAELNIMHLSEEEQEEVLDGLGEVLVRRVLLKILENLPEEERANFGKLLEANDDNAIQAMIQKHVKNPQDIVLAELREGIEEHKILVNEQVKARLEKEVEAGVAGK